MHNVEGGYTLVQRYCALYFGRKLQIKGAQYEDQKIRFQNQLKWIEQYIDRNLK